MKKILLAFVAILAVFSLAACSNKSTSSNTWTTAEKTKKITIGFDNTFVPMGFKAKDGSNQGFDIDIANAIFKNYGITVDWQPINWNMKEQELKDGNIDLIWNGYSVTPSRQKLVLFSDVYMHSGQVLITKKSSGITTVADMKGKTVGVQSGSSGLDEFNSQPNILKNIVKDGAISQYSNFDEGFLDVQNGRIDALLADESYANYYLTQNGKASQFNMIKTAFDGGDMAVGARKSDTELISKINAGFTALRKSGEFQKISQKWFGKDVWPGASN